MRVKQQGVGKALALDSLAADGAEAQEEILPALAAIEAYAARRRPLAARREAARAALVASGDAAPTLLANYDLTRGTLAERWFYAQALEAGFTEVVTDEWPHEGGALEVNDLLVFRVDDAEHVYRLADGTLAHVALRGGWLGVHTAGPSNETAREACSAFRAAYPATYLQDVSDSRVPITFWSDSPFGPVPRLRRIEASAWAPIQGNYAADARGELDRLMGWSDGPDKDGQLLLWQGPPGTGKTWALRALASEWAPWAEFHFITDPDAFFVKNPSYMIDVLLSDSYMAIDPGSGDVFHEDGLGKWKILILEDTGELLSADAKEQYGQGLSRLLNVVDGMIGQGLRVLAIVTTNDELGELHPAVSRPGRCASQIVFGPLDAAEASAFLGEPADEGGTLAELYERQGEGAAPEFAMPGCAGCDHAYTAHLGSEGPCTTDGCSCSGYEAAEAAALEASARPEVIRVAVPEGRSLSDLVHRLDADGKTVTLTFDVALLPEHQPGATLPATTPGPVVDAAPTAGGEIEWTAILAPEGKMTSDGRAFAPGSITWRELPLTLMAMIETSEGGHVGAEVAGRIDRIWRDEAAGVIRAGGVFADTEYGSLIASAVLGAPFQQEAVALVASALNCDEETLLAGLVGNQTLRGVSVDLAIHRYDIGPRSDWFDDDGNWAPKDAAEADDRSLIDILYDDSEPDVAVVLEAEIGMTTVCPFPAFAEARIAVGQSLVAGASRELWTATGQAGFTGVLKGLGVALAASGASEALPVQECLECQEEALSASAAGLAVDAPDASWFENPKFEGPTAPTLDDDGRFYGHAATWETCHIGIQGRCQQPPHSDTGYALFHLGEVLCSGGERVSVGTVTLDTGHAANGLGRADATRHYDHTGTAVAYVRCGEDEHGIWFAGALRPDVSAEKATLLRGAKLSGDWRRVDGNLELVALLTVNVPGFPVPRSRTEYAGADVVTLVAAGIPIFESDIDPADRARFEELRQVARFAELAAEAA